MYFIRQPINLGEGKMKIHIFTKNNLCNTENKKVLAENHLWVKVKNASHTFKPIINTKSQMDTQKIIQFITRQEKILLGVSSKLALRLNLQPIVIRIVFVVLTLLFIPLGILAYLGGYLILNKMAGKMLILALIGAFLGIPFSYYFQSEMVQRMAGGIMGYVKNFVSIVDDVDRFVGNGMDIIWDAMIGVVVFMLIGGAIGYFMDASKRKSGQNDEK